MARKWAVLAVLLSLPINLVEARNRVSVEAGHEAVLSCPNISKVSLLLVAWKRNCSSCCLFSYRSDRNETSKLNCSERITWKYSPVSNPDLRIYPVGLGDEGNYTCETANSEGSFRFFSSLTVIVPPTVTLTHDRSRVAVCQASAGKPAADISWIPASNHSSEEEFHHPNGTVTRVSYFGWANSSFPSVTCLVTHPATNQTLLMNLTLGSPWLASSCPPSCSVAPPLQQDREKNTMDSSWVKVKTGRDHSPITVTGNTDLRENTSHRLLYILTGAAAGVAAVTVVASCLIFRCRACWLRTRARGPAEHFTTKTSKFAPSRVRREADEPHEFPESIYENYKPVSLYVYVQQSNRLLVKRQHFSFHFGNGILFKVLRWKPESDMGRPQNTEGQSNKSNRNAEIRDF